MSDRMSDRMSEDGMLEDQRSRDATPANAGRAMSRRRLLSWSAASAAGIALVTAVNPAYAAGPPPGVPAGAGPGVRPRPRPRPRPVYRIRDLLPGAPANAVALTIDDGPHPVWTPQVLDVLRRNNVRATFSLIGIQAHAQASMVRRILAEGHSICNHTMTHPQPFGRCSPARIKAELVDSQTVIVEAGGRKPRLFRSPGGDWSPAVFSGAAAEGMIPIDWDVDPRDWTRPGTAPIVRSLVAARPGDILLCHDGGGDRSQTVAALRQVLPRLRAEGLTFVTL